MPESPRAGAAPWITAAVLGVVLAVLLVLWLAVLRPDHANADVGQLTTREQTAINAAATEAENLLSYRRSHFNADYGRALAGTTGSLRKDVTNEKAKTLKAMRTGKFDLSAKVEHTGLVGPVSKGSKSGYVVLLTVNAYQSTHPNVPTPQDLQVTIVEQHGKWLVDDVQSVGIS